MKARYECQPVSTQDYSLTNSTYKRAEMLLALQGSRTLNKVWVRMKKTGSPAGNVTVRIETDSGGAPSGTLAWANATATVAATSITSDSWHVFTLTASGTHSGNLWVVVSYDTTDGTNYVTVVASSGGWGTALYYDGAAWSHPNNDRALCVIAEYTDGTILGNNFITGTQYNIYGTIGVRVGWWQNSPAKIAGVVVNTTRSGNGAALRVRLYSGSTLLATGTQLSWRYNSSSTTKIAISFDGPVIVPTGQCYLIIDTNGAGDASNKPQLQCGSLSSSGYRGYSIYSHGFTVETTADVSVGSPSWSAAAWMPAFGFIWEAEGVGMETWGLQSSQDGTIYRGASGSSMKLVNPGPSPNADTYFYANVAADVAVSFSVYIRGDNVPASAGVQPQLIIPAQLGITETIVDANITQADTFTQVTIGPVTPTSAGVLAIGVRIREVSSANTYWIEDFA